MRITILRIAYLSFLLTPFYILLANNVLAADDQNAEIQDLKTSDCTNISRNDPSERSTVTDSAKFKKVGSCIWVSFSPPVRRSPRAMYEAVNADFSEISWLENYPPPIQLIDENTLRITDGYRFDGAGYLKDWSIVIYNGEELKVHSDAGKLINWR